MAGERSTFSIPDEVMGEAMVLNVFFDRRAAADAKLLELQQNPDGLPDLSGRTKLAREAVWGARYYFNFAERQLDITLGRNGLERPYTWPEVQVRPAPVGRRQETGSRMGAFLRTYGFSEALVRVEK